MTYRGRHRLSDYAAKLDWYWGCCFSRGRFRHYRLRFPEAVRG